MAVAKPQIDETMQEEFERDLDAQIRACADIADIERLLAGEGIGVVFDQDGQALLFECEPELLDEEAPVLTEAPEDGQPAKVVKGRFATILERVGGDLANAKKYANWLLGKRQKAEQELVAAQLLAAENIRQINEFLARVQKRHDRALGWMDWSLLGFLRESGEKKIELPRGDLAWEKKRKQSTWNEPAGLVFAVSRSINEAARLTEEWAAAEAGKEEPHEVTDDEREDYLWARFAELLAELVVIKKDPIKKLLDKREDGSYGWVNADGEERDVISSNEVGEVPLLPRAEGADPEAPRKPMAWCKPGETYEQRIKPR